MKSPIRTDRDRRGGMTKEALAALGADRLVYIRPAKNDDGTAGFIVHAADGHQLGRAGSYDEAMAAVIMNDRHAVALH